jgi:hypothetical protein
MCSDPLCFYELSIFFREIVVGYYMVELGDFSKETRVYISEFAGIRKEK